MAPALSLLHPLKPTIDQCVQGNLQDKKIEKFKLDSFNNLERYSAPNIFEHAPKLTLKKLYNQSKINLFASMDLIYLFLEPFARSKDLEDEEILPLSGALLIGRGVDRKYFFGGWDWRP